MDIASQLAAQISSSKVFGASENIRHGKYKFLITNIIAQEVDGEAGKHRMAFWEFEVLEAAPNPQVEGDRVDYLGPNSPGVGPLKDDGMRPNPVGSKCALKVDFDGAGGRSAGSNIKAAILGLFGKREGEISEAEVGKTWTDLERQRDVKKGQPIGVDSSGQVILAQQDKRAQPARGMIIYCTTRSKKKKTANDKGAYITQLMWDCGGSPPGVADNAPALVAERRARIELGMAGELDNAPVAAAPVAFAPVAAAPVASAPAPMPPAPPVLPSAPLSFMPPAPWELHPDKQYQGSTPDARWYWSNPARGGDNSLKTEAQLRS